MAPAGGVGSEGWSQPSERRTPPHGAQLAAHAKAAPERGRDAQHSSVTIWNAQAPRPSCSYTEQPIAPVDGVEVDAWSRNNNGSGSSRAPGTSGNGPGGRPKLPGGGACGWLPGCWGAWLPLPCWGGWCCNWFRRSATGRLNQIRSPLTPRLLSCRRRQCPVHLRRRNQLTPRIPRYPA